MSLLLTLNTFHTFFSVSIVDFEQVIAFLSSVSETNSHNFGDADKTLSVPKKIILFFTLQPLLYLRLYVFCTKTNKTEIISG